MRVCIYWYVIYYCRNYLYLHFYLFIFVFLFFNQKTAYEMRISAWSSDVCSSDLDLQPDLPDGTYVVSYRVISADGHPVRGGSVFGVGAGEVDAGALGRVTGDDGDRVWDVVGAFGRAFAYGGSILAAGGALFLVLVHRGGSDRARLVRVVRIAAAVGAVGSLVAQPVQAALGTGQGPGSRSGRANV